MTVTVLCVLFDGRAILPGYSGGVGYDASWVNKLHRGFRRHSGGIPFRFLALVDDPDAYGIFDAEVEVAPLLDPDEGWMNLLEIFRPDLGIERGVFVGLDTIICGSVAPLLRWDGHFGWIRSPQRPQIGCNGVLAFGRRFADKLWKRWNGRRVYWRKVCSHGLGAAQVGHPSEVVFLRRNKESGWVYLDDLYPGHFASYKCHHDRIADARIVYFHGDPKPPFIPEAELLENWA